MTGPVYACVTLNVTNLGFVLKKFRIKLKQINQQQNLKNIMLMCGYVSSQKKSQ